MCGRFTLASPSQAIEQMGFELPFELSPRYNLAPGQDILAVVNRESDAVCMLRWGLVPQWKKGGRTIINARAESVADKSLFRDAFAERRCLIPADGFYEWQSTAGQNKKQPHHLHQEDHSAFAFAGIWGVGRDGPDNCVILTVSASASVSDIHGRMPMVMPKKHWPWWLGSDKPESESWNELVGQCAALPWKSRPVSSLVNSVSRDGPELMERSEPAQGSLF